MVNDLERSIAPVWEVIRRIARWALYIILAFAVVYLFYRLRTVVASVMAAVLLTYILLPGVDWLCSKRNKRLRPRTQRMLATILIFIVFLAAIAAAVSIFIVPLTAELNELPNSPFVKSLGPYQKWFEQTIAKISEAMPANVMEVVSRVDFSNIAGWAVDNAKLVLRLAISSVRAALEIVLIPVLAFYFLFDYRTITREMYGLVPRARRREAVRIGRIIGEILQSYIFGQVILCVIAGVLTGLFLAALGVKYVVVLALFAAITRAIPVIGPVVSGIPIVLVGALGSDGLALPIYLLTFITVMHFAESKFLMPHLIGKRMHLHPAVVIIVLLIGAEFFGLAGMFLAAPVAAVIRDLVRIYYIKPRDRAEISSDTTADVEPIPEAEPAG